MTEDKISAAFRALPGVLTSAKGGPSPATRYHRWLVVMGMHDTLNMLTGARVLW